jgi:hypothetical protein
MAVLPLSGVEALKPSAQAQSVVPTPSSVAAPGSALPSTLSSTLDHIAQTLAGLNVSRWKAPGEVRSVTQRDIDSIQRDLSATLPPLLTRANTPPPSVASYFAVYRNIDALYDVLLRVSETATLAGPQNDASSLQAALASLEAARRDLGDEIAQTAGGQERELVGLRVAAAEAAAAAAAKPPPLTKTVVEDGPAPAPKATPATRHKKKPVASAPAGSPSTPASTPVAPQ